MTPDTELARVERIHRYLAAQALFHSERSDAAVPFRLALTPYALPASWRAELKQIGLDLAAFQRALQELYREAERRSEWRFLLHWLDGGKDETILQLGRLRRQRRALPVLIRPDLFRVDDRFVASEIDAVPGGFGVVAALQEAYGREGFACIGGQNGIVQAFVAAMRLLAGKDDPVVAIVVSDESADYLPEMLYLAERCQEAGYAVYTLHPRQVAFREEGLFLPDGQQIDVLYRFFELFDWKNVPKAELFFYAYKKGRVAITAPIKAYLEEKLAFAAFHHPRLKGFWRAELGEAFDRLERLLPPTWAVEHETAPAQAFLYGLDIAGEPVQSFHELAHLSQRERRRWVLKPSGFSPLAWGSRGVHVGEDLPAEAWQAALEVALQQSRQGGPFWCLQAYAKPDRTEVSFRGADGGVERMLGRARISPYFFRTSEEHWSLAGVLVTVCPLDKKVIHGMVDGVVAPGGPAPEMLSACPGCATVKTAAEG